MVCGGYGAEMQLGWEQQVNGQLTQHAYPRVKRRPMSYTLVWPKTNSENNQRAALSLLSGRHQTCTESGCIRIHLKAALSTRI